MTDATKTPFLTVEEAAIYLRLKKRTLDNMRGRGVGPGVGQGEVGRRLPLAEGTGLAVRGEHEDGQIQSGSWR